MNRPPELLHLQAELLELGGSDDGLANGTKADLQAAKRLAKRLYNLEGFRKSDVARHLSKKSVRMCTSPPPTVADLCLAADACLVFVCLQQRVQPDGRGRIPEQL